MTKESSTKAQEAPAFIRISDFEFLSDFVIRHSSLAKRVIRHSQRGSFVICAARIPFFLNYDR